VFRRRRRDEADPQARDSSEDEYLADDELPEDEDLDDEDDDLIDADEYEGADEYEDEDEADEPEYEVAATADDADGEGTARATASRAPRDDLGDPDTWTRLRDSATTEPVHMRASGPWDSADEYPEGERVDLGCLLVPVRDGSDVQIGFSEETGVTIGVVAADSMLQLQAFAAPRSSGLWHEVRPEIADEVAKAGGSSQEQDGPFGPELMAWITPPPQEDGLVIPPQPLRFLGADGPRWFLRGLITGPAALDTGMAQPLEDAFADTVVVRGDHAEPPRKPLDIRLPEQAAQLIEEQAAAAAAEQGLPNPFERGPEITETR
jgi:Protein of unknown function (DUF3710)